MNRVLRLKSKRIAIRHEYCFTQTAGSFAGHSGKRISVTSESSCSKSLFTTERNLSPKRRIQAVKLKQKTKETDYNWFQNSPREKWMVVADGKGIRPLVCEGRIYFMIHALL